MNTQTSSPKTTADQYSVFAGGRAQNGSRNPIDAEGHWDWRNPLNILPFGIVLIVLAALVSLVI